ncbi:MAG: 50S ribosomal protein L10 [Parcubacteria group bacterium GW2011_GWA2_39_18]|nr:MAG: 50S ribosomal protein L10 [Parcubacteria group bacterium GW2011_GWA2_39_18]
MPRTRQQKELTLKEAAENISRARSLVFVGMSGISVAKLTELRKQMRKQEVSFTVIKKTLLKKALEQNNFKADKEVFEDKNIFGMAVGTKDEVAPAKIIYDFAKKEMMTNKNFKLNMSGGFLLGDFLTAQAVNNLGKLPSKEQLIAQFVYTIAAPLKNMLYTLSAVRDKLTV